MIKVLQQICVDWGLRCFGVDHMKNKGVRALRFCEEAIELAQTCNVTREKMHALVDVVYSRPPGQQYQEVGGSMVTLLVLCSALAIDPEDALLVEVRRCLSKDPEHFAERNKEKLDLGLHVMP